ncbi:nutrient deprivation-induced protein [Rhizobium sp. 9T]|uniref:Nutrient deprivation-induced protein n=1 Tax=Rhizobium croatiense TaxID=2867516 RepID=A0ABS7LT98_9HYPH|nr:nutrient deprivation-induced protein [Rhizobium croatiense]MBY4609411.1 nutrient deprivation-induced protein [Rhizobium croatiense]MBY4628070.1 nutrient deprivation-induced protein [Rhizobium croatiense]
MTDVFSAPEGERSRPANPSPTTELKDKISDDISATKEMVKEASDAGLDKAKAVVSEQVHFAAHQLSGIAIALEKVGAELESSDQRHVGRYARELGRSVASAARRVEGKDLREMAILAEDFGRRQPIAFLGIAALAGLTASRFLTASAKRTDKAQNDKARTTAPSAPAFVSGSKDNQNG